MSVEQPFPFPVRTFTNVQAQRTAKGWTAWRIYRWTYPDGTIQYKRGKVVFARFRWIALLKASHAG